MPVGSDRGGGLLQPLWHANSGTMRQLQEPESFGQQVLPFVRHGFFYRNRQQRTYDWSGVEEPSSFVRCVSPMQENQRGWIYILLLVRPPSRREIAGAFSGSSGEAGCVVRTSGSHWGKSQDFSRTGRTCWILDQVCSLSDRWHYFLCCT